MRLIRKLWDVMFIQVFFGVDNQIVGKSISEGIIIFSIVEG